MLCSVIVLHEMIAMCIAVNGASGLPAWSFRPMWQELQACDFVGRPEHPAVRLACCLLKNVAWSSN